jgi:hypothetical protein
VCVYYQHLYMSVVIKVFHLKCSVEDKDPTSPYNTYVGIKFYILLYTLNGTCFAGSGCCGLVCWTVSRLNVYFRLHEILGRGCTGLRHPVSTRGEDFAYLGRCNETCLEGSLPVYRDHSGLVPWSMHFSKRTFVCRPPVHTSNTHSLKLLGGLYRWVLTFLNYEAPLCWSQIWPTRLSMVTDLTHPPVSGHRSDPPTCQWSQIWPTHLSVVTDLTHPPVNGPFWHRGTKDDKCKTSIWWVYTWGRPTVLFL